MSYFLFSQVCYASTSTFGSPRKSLESIEPMENLMAIKRRGCCYFTFIPLTLFFIFWIFTNIHNITYFFLIASSFFCILTVYCTAKIYSSLKAIPSWHNPFVPIIYILNSIVLGSIITFTIFFYFNIKINFLSNIIVILSLTTLFLKILYWYSISKDSKSNILQLQVWEVRN